MPTPVTLLVAYPKELIRAGLRAMLTGSGIKIVGEAVDAPSTLSLAKKHKPAVVILDAAIPGSDAFGLVAELSKTMPATKLVMLSANNNPTYMARARAVGRRAIERNEDKVEHETRYPSNSTERSNSMVPLTL